MSEHESQSDSEPMEAPPFLSPEEISHLTHQEAIEVFQKQLQWRDAQLAELKEAAIVTTRAAAKISITADVITSVDTLTDRVTKLHSDITQFDPAIVGERLDVTDAKAQRRFQVLAVIVAIAFVASVLANVIFGVVILNQSRANNKSIKNAEATSMRIEEIVDFLRSVQDPNSDYVKRNQEASAALVKALSDDIAARDAANNAPIIERLDQIIAALNNGK